MRLLKVVFRTTAVKLCWHESQISSNHHSKNRRNIHGIFLS